MCSIMGYCGSGATFASFSEAFDKTVLRGPDDTKIIDTGKGLLGFHRLAIMGLTPSGMQWRKTVSVSSLRISTARESI